jgi:hypothetical protein
MRSFNYEKEGGAEVQLHVFSNLSTKCLWVVG